jgi:hypothetical protein
VTRVKSNAVAYAAAEPPKGKRKRGRPKRYGKKIRLKSLLADARSMLELASPVYGERNVMLRYRVCDLIWRPAGSAAASPGLSLCQSALQAAHAPHRSTAQHISSPRSVAAP